MKLKTNISNVQSFLNSASESARKQIRLSVISAGLNGVLLILGAWLLASIIKDVVFENISVNGVANKIIALIVIYTSRAIIIFFAERCAFLGAVNVKLAIRQAIIKKIIERGPAGMSKEKSGSIISAYMEGVDALHNYYALSLPSRIIAVMIPLAVFIVIVPIDFISAVILLMTAPFIPLFMIWIGKGADSLNQKQWRRMTYLGGYFLDKIQGVVTLKLFNASHREAKVILKLSEEFRRDTMAVLRIAFLSSLALEFFATVSIAMIAVLIAFRLLWGSLDFTQGFFILLLAPEFYLPLRKMGTNYHAKMEAIGASEKIIELISFDKQNEPRVNFQDREVSIVFENISFAYEDGPLILDGVNFNIARGEKIAFAGVSGSGKSTAIALLLGFLRPQSGRILINGINFQDIYLNDWYQNISWMPQNPRLFTGSIVSNIRMARPDAHEADINELISACGISNFLELPIGENGQGVSGGQLQRIAMARALLRHSPLVLLDEPTAHLDQENQSLLHNALNRYTKNSTVIFAAHRAGSLSIADRIFYFSNGKISEQKEAIK